ncbi:MAG: ATP-binding protein [bacterium]
MESIDFLDEQTYEGPLLSQLDNALAFVARNTHQAYKITGKPEREIVPEYPEEAVREAIINALCHRDYTSVATIQVRIFDDRLEVWNPGCLPYDITLKMLYHQHHSHPRNPMIADAFFRARLIEHWGSGTTRIVSACRAGNIKAEFLMEGGCFIVCLRKQSESRPESRPESDVPVRILQALIQALRQAHDP